MHTFTSTEVASQPYVSRKKRYRRRTVTEVKSVLSTRTTLGLLGLLVLALLISLGVIAASLVSDNSAIGCTSISTSAVA
ncbi:hypothetical protein [Solirubrum puertoriconensis]|uniref:Uncharacterized protein n=1 Tax=Solirubrum puertoriconensis TaxID=1751427 RepID=A0A9X0HHJ2_SOLP1|nr:hypothetical protein [Solirubrum puertoriconensis]KUG05999.1 hypothetical protein ASU33_01085 [Solirubrum puertoriconensis]